MSWLEVGVQPCAGLTCIVSGIGLRLDIPRLEVSSGLGEVSFASPADRAGGSWLTRPARNRRARRFIRTSVLLTVLGLMRFAGGAGPRGRLVLAGGMLTVAGIVLRSQPAGVVLLPGLLLIVRGGAAERGTPPAL